MTERRKLTAEEIISPVAETYDEAQMNYMVELVNHADERRVAAEVMNTELIASHRDAIQRLENVLEKEREDRVVTEQLIRNALDEYRFEKRKLEYLLLNMLDLEREIDDGPSPHNMILALLEVFRSMRQNEAYVDERELRTLWKRELKEILENK